MSRRATSLSNNVTSGLTRDVNSKYDIIKAVSKYLVEIELLSELDLVNLTSRLESIADFEGLTVISGVTASWDDVNKILTVPTIQGDIGPVSTTPGPIGADGPGVDHVKKTSTTHVGGLFSQPGEIDTYTVYGDLEETQIFGTFELGNGKQGPVGETGLVPEITFSYVDGNIVSDITGVVDNTNQYEWSL